jgi:hypothetical protein
VTRNRARKALFVCIAAAALVYILRDQLANAPYAFGHVLPGENAVDDFTSDFFADRWALALCVLAVTYFAYRLAAAPKD